MDTSAETSTDRWHLYVFNSQSFFIIFTQEWNKLPWSTEILGDKYSLIFYVVLMSSAYKSKNKDITLTVTPKYQRHVTTDTMNAQSFKFVFSVIIQLLRIWTAKIWQILDNLLGNILIRTCKAMYFFVYSVFISRTKLNYINSVLWQWYIVWKLAVPAEISGDITELR